MIQEQIQPFSVNHPNAGQQFDNLCLKSKDKIILLYENYSFEIEKKKTEKIIVDFKKHQRVNYQLDQRNIKEKIKFKQIYGITQLTTTSYLILVTSSKAVGTLKSNIIYKAQQFQFIQIGSQTQSQPLLSHLKKSFNILDFYYSKQDLSQRLQFELVRPAFYQHSFISNYKYTLEYDNFPLELLTKFIFGFAQTITISKERQTYQLSLISRGNFNSVGRRWMRRGINQNRAAATHYETQIVLEIISSDKTTIYSTVQMRGSLPLIWSQTPNYSIKAPISVCPNQQKTKDFLAAYLDKQQELQIKLKIVNLMDKKGAQGSLSQLFTIYFNDLNRQHSSLLWFDFNAEYSKFKETAFNHFIDQIRNQLNEYRFFKGTKNTDDYQYNLKSTQKGTFRTNCLHCLDRTNFMQSVISKMHLFAFLDDHSQQNKRHYPFQSMEIPELEDSFKKLWIANASAISFQNSGAPAMKICYYDSGKRTAMGLLQDFVVGTKRYFQGIQSNYYLQNCLDLHFKHLKIKHSSGIYGDWTKTARLFTSLFIVVLLSVVIFKLLNIETFEKKGKALIKIIGSLLTILIGGAAIKAKSQLFIQSPIVSWTF